MTAPTVSRAVARLAGLESSSRQPFPGLASTRMASQVLARKHRDVRLAGPTCRAENSTRRQPERHHFAEWLDGDTAMSAAIERRHQPQLAQASQLKPNDSPRPQFRVTQMPQGNPRRVEQPGMRVVVVGQIGQQFGDIVAGIQGRKIAAKRCKALDRRRLGKQVERLGRLRKHHDIGNAQEVKSTL